MAMNRLPAAKRIQILSLLCEGASMRSVSRLADVSINTVSGLLVKAGRVCDEFHEEKVRGVKARRVQVDEPTLGQARHHPRRIGHEQDPVSLK